MAASSTASRSGKQQQSLPPSLAWLTVFIPALAYFIASRTEHTRIGGRNLGVPVLTIDINKENNNAALAQSVWAANTLFRVQSDGLASVVDSVWKHDPELGRGFLLLSQSANHGRIWRWEVGGGPISIGRTLYMEPSGCRSNRTHVCSGGNLGSGGLTVATTNHDEHSRLMVAEWGEGRIVRVEDETGARTPLVLEVPSLCGTTGMNGTEGMARSTVRRVYQPRALLFTPFGDLVFQDTDPDCDMDGLYLLPDAVVVPPLSTAMESRRAHGWTTLPESQARPKLLLKAKKIGGIDLDAAWTGIYYTATDDVDIGDAAAGAVDTVDRASTVTRLYHMNLATEEEDDDAEDDNDNDDGDEEANKEGDTDGNGTEKDKRDSRSAVALDTRIVADFTESTPAGPVAMDQSGILFVGVDTGVVVLPKELSVKEATQQQGKSDERLFLPVPDTPTSITVGGDKFLYVTTADDLYRIRIQTGPQKVPTDLIRKKTKSSGGKKG